MAIRKIIGWTSALSAALGLSIATSNPPALAGNLNRCDLARIAGHNIVQDKYSEVLSLLDGLIVRASAAGFDPMMLPYRSADNATTSLDLVALKERLKNQEASDLGYANRRIALECSDNTTSLDDLRKIAEEAALRSISVVLPKSLQQTLSDAIGNGGSIRSAQPNREAAGEVRKTE